jgi:hypothetical protein
MIMLELPKLEISSVLPDGCLSVATELSQLSASKIEALNRKKHLQSKVKVETHGFAAPSETEVENELTIPMPPTPGTTRNLSQQASSYTSLVVISQYETLLPARFIGEIFYKRCHLRIKKQHRST